MREDSRYARTMIREEIPYLKRSAPFILVLGDLIALSLFVLVGQRDHETIDPTNPLLGMLPNVVAFAIPWSIAAWRLGAIRIDAPFRIVPFFARTLNAWLVAAPFGLLLRSAILGRAVIPTMFVVATLGFGLLFLLAWRVVFAWVRMFANRKQSGK